LTNKNKEKNQKTYKTNKLTNQLKLITQSNKQNIKYQKNKLLKNNNQKEILLNKEKFYDKN
jgi:hypothetical protein